MTRAGLAPAAPALFLAAQAVLVRAESFDQPGGWALAPRTAERMGSPFLPARGVRQPVIDAILFSPYPGSRPPDGREALPKFRSQFSGFTPEPQPDSQSDPAFVRRGISTAVDERRLDELNAVLTQVAPPPPQMTRPGPPESGALNFAISRGGVQ